MKRQHHLINYIKASAAKIKKFKRVVEDLVGQNIALSNEMESLNSELQRKMTEINVLKGWKSLLMGHVKRDEIIKDKIKLLVVPAVNNQNTNDALKEILSILYGKTGMEEKSNRNVVKLIAPRDNASRRRFQDSAKILIFNKASNAENKIHKSAG
jgi:hypothetical protein